MWEIVTVHPETRVKMVVETARAVLEDRLDPAQAAAAVGLQAEQLTPLLRGDRIDVTQAESNDVATRLSLLAEQVNDKASESHDPEAVEAHVAIAEALGELSQALR
jgi:hypothetical protein